MQARKSKYLDVMELAARVVEQFISQLKRSISHFLAKIIQSAHT